MLFDYNWNSRIGGEGYEDGSLGRCAVNLVARSMELLLHVTSTQKASATSV